jgi:hypothetical protein
MPSRSSPNETPPIGISPKPHALLVPVGSAISPGKMYLRLYHGRKNPDEVMEDWGFTGPVFGPLSGYVQTYRCTLRLIAVLDDEEIWLNTCEDRIVWDGSYHGDLEVVVTGPDEQA